ncbi:hypothetical protein BGW39_010729 [Mortierella sp. 14UC]|nr:hypothetical protein BGW39_010729 [Mortierella sp. 14UC]
MFETAARAYNWSARTKLDVVVFYLHEDHDTRTWFQQNQHYWEMAHVISASPARINTAKDSSHATIVNTAKIFTTTSTRGGSAVDDEDEKKFKTFKTMFAAKF